MKPSQIQMRDPFVPPHGWVADGPFFLAPSFYPGVGTKRIKERICAFGPVNPR